MMMMMLVLRILIDHGADVNVQDEEELTPLHCAARWAPGSSIEQSYLTLSVLCPGTAMESAS